MDKKIIGVLPQFTDPSEMAVFFFSFFEILQIGKQGFTKKLVMAQRREKS